MKADSQILFRNAWNSLTQAPQKPLITKPGQMERGSSSHLPIHVLLQTDGTVGGGAAAERVRGSAAALAQALSLGLELPRLHLLQGLDGHPVHGALRGDGGQDAVRGSGRTLLPCKTVSPQFNATAFLLFLDDKCFFFFFLPF